MVDEIVVSEFWSEDKTKHAKVCSNQTIYPNMFKLVMNESDKNHQIFKFFKDLNKAEMDAEDYVLGK
jgi:hypothetical protein